MSSFKDITKLRFGRLVAIERNGLDRGGVVMWDCLCDCGNKKTISGGSLRRGDTKSCGCLHKEKTSERSKNKKLTSRTRKKMSKARKGKKNCMYGKKHSMQARKKISESKKGQNAGKTHYRWNPQLTDGIRQDRRMYPEYILWRNKIYQRDSYTCKVCNDSKGGNLIAHHLEGYKSNPNLQLSVENGVTVCKKCHTAFHHIYGWGNNTKKQFSKFIEDRSV